jgi:hypothetical protein
MGLSIGQLKGGVIHLRVFVESSGQFCGLMLEKAVHCLGILHYGCAWARAQQRALPVIGMLSPLSADDDKIVTISFLQGLKESGYVEGQNVEMEYRWAENQDDRLLALAANLVRRRVTVDRGRRSGPSAGGEQRVFLTGINPASDLSCPGELLA